MKPTCRGTLFFAIANILSITRELSHLSGQRTHVGTVAYTVANLAQALEKAIESCHGPYRKLCEPLLSDAGRAFCQVQGPGPIGLEQAGRRRPVNVPVSYTHLT